MSQRSREGISSYSGKTRQDDHHRDGHVGISRRAPAIDVRAASHGASTEDGAAPSRRARWATWGRQFHRGRVLEIVVGVGLVTYGVVYLLVAVIAARMAITGHRTADTPYAALDELADSVSGEVLLWLTAMGLIALTLWRLMDILWRRDPLESRVRRATGRLGSFLSGIGYCVLAISALKVALDGPSERAAVGSPTGPELGVDPWAVRLIVTAAGVVLFVVAAWSAFQGLRSLFLGDLKAGTRSIVVRLGQAGYIGRGVTFGIVGGMFIWSAVGHHIGRPDLRTVFRLINISPTGQPLLLLKAVGLSLFGAYCLAWAANRRR